MKKLIAANWKMYKTPPQATQTANDLRHELDGKVYPDREIVVFPPFTDIFAVVHAFADSGIEVGGQNCYPESEGAFTGEISPSMLVGAGCSFVLVGHSERRRIFNEKNKFIAEKVSAALHASLKVILCVGETLEEREAGALKSVLEKQIIEGTEGVVLSDPSKLSVAYEPVWAIGTGKVAGMEEIGEAHAIIRAILKDRFAEGFADVRILYGGSVKPDNAGAIMKLDNVNGLLVGGASLQAASFAKIIFA